jgi:hypothetical protein
MKFTFRNGDELIHAEMSKSAGIKYAEAHGYEIESMGEEPTPMNENEVEEMLLDLEYRVTLLENGLGGEL